MSGARKLKPGDKPFIVGVGATIALAAALIFQVHRASIPNSSYPKIDPVAVQRLIEKGEISGRDAEYFEVMPTR